VSPGLGTRTRPPTAPTPPVDPRIQARRDQVDQERTRRRRRRLVVAAVVAVLAATAWFVTHGPFLDVDRIAAVGTPNVPVSQVVETAGIRSGQHLVEVDEGAARARLRALPWVADAKVSVGWDGTARLSVTERVPVVAVVDGPNRWTLADAKGRALASVGAVPPGVIPVAGVASVAPGTTFGSGLDAPLDLVARLTPGLRTRVASIVVGKDGAIGMTLDPEGVVLLCQPTALGQKLSTLTTFFAHVDDRGLATVDACIPGSLDVTRVP
jgi:POTRA domain, FtsQ-type